MPIEDVVAENEAARVVADEVAADEKCLRESARIGLRGVCEIESPLRAVAEQTPKERLIVGSGDEEDVDDAGEHQRRQRVVDHRLVVDRQELLGYDGRDRVKAGSGASGEDDSFSHRRALKHEPPPSGTASPAVD